MPKKGKGKGKKAGMQSHSGAVKTTQGVKDRGGLGIPTCMRPRGTGGVADTARVTLRYVQELSIASTAGAYTTNVFRGNGAFDPDQTGTGAQPVWYDDYSAMYNRNRCLGSRIFVVPTQSTNTGLCTYVGITPQHQTTSMATVAQAVSQPYTEFTSCSPYSPTRVLSQSMGTSKYLGYPGGGMMGSDALENLYSASPAHQWYWHVWMRSADGSTSITNSIIVIIDYDLLWFDKVDGSLDQELRRLTFMKEGRVVEVKTDGKVKAEDLKKMIKLSDAGDVKEMMSEDVKSDWSEDYVSALVDAPQSLNEHPKTRPNTPQLKAPVEVRQGRNLSNEPLSARALGLMPRSGPQPLRG